MSVARRRAIAEKAADVAVGLVLAGLLLAGASSCSRIQSYFADGRSELQKAFEAKKKASSFKSRTEVTAPHGRKLVTESVVSCPDKQAMKTTLDEVTYESVRIGETGYVQVAAGQPWRKMPIPADAIPCGANAGVPAPWAVMSEGTDVLTTLALMAEGASFKRGPRVETEAGACQQWIMGFSHPGAEGKPGGQHADRRLPG